ncbi:MAG: 4a-hydroxytetrahydrobiopterin dehydratase [Rhodothermaceae bacterium]
MEKLSGNEIQEKLRDLNIISENPWQLNGDAIEKEFLFEDFIRAFSFMTKVAIVVEKFSHHPEWTNIFNRVIVTLRTHEADGLTNLDFDIANEIEHLL